MMKFKPEVYAASESDQWHLLSALRGPDAGSLMLKQLTIAVRRAVIADIGEYAKFRLIDLQYGYGYGNKLTQSDFDSLRAEFPQAPRHWRDHIYEALLVAEKLNILDDTGKSLLKEIEKVAGR